MAIALTLTSAFESGGVMVLMGTVAFSGSYSTGGDTLNLQSLIGQNSNQGLALDSTQQPDDIEFNSQNGGWGASTASSGGRYIPVKGSTTANWKLQAWATGGTELGAGAYPAAPAGPLGDIVVFRMAFQRPK